MKLNVIISLILASSLLHGAENIQRSTLIEQTAQAYTQLASNNPTERSKALRWFFYNRHDIIVDIKIAHFSDGTLTIKGPMATALIKNVNIVDFFASGTFTFVKDKLGYRKLLIVGVTTLPPIEAYKKVIREYNPIHMGNTAIEMTDPRTVLSFLRAIKRARAKTEKKN